jgi:hypothetical protein
MPAYYIKQVIQNIQLDGNKHISSPQSICSDPVQIGIATHATWGDLV